MIIIIFLVILLNGEVINMNGSASVSMMSSIIMFVLSIGLFFGVGFGAYKAIINIIFVARIEPA